MKNKKITVLKVKSKYTSEHLDSEENLKFLKLTKMFAYLGGPLVLCGTTLLFLAFFIYSLSLTLTIIGSVLLFLPFLSWLIFSFCFEHDEIDWKIYRRDKSKPFHGRLLKDDDYDSTSESI